MGSMMCVMHNAGEERALAAGLVKSLLGLGAAVFSQARNACDASQHRAEQRARKRGGSASRALVLRSSGAAAVFRRSVA